MYSKMKNTLLQPLQGNLLICWCRRKKASEIGRRCRSLLEEKMCLIWETACYEMRLAFDLCGREQFSGIPGCVWMGLQGSSSPSSLSGPKVAAWVIQTVGVWRPSSQMVSPSKVRPSLKLVMPGAQTGRRVHFVNRWVRGFFPLSNWNTY